MNLTRNIKSKLLMLLILSTLVLVSNFSIVFADNSDELGILNISDSTLGIANVVRLEDSLYLDDFSFAVCKMLGYNDAIDMDAEYNTGGDYCASILCTNNIIPMEWLHNLNQPLSKGAFYSTLYKIYNLDITHPEYFTEWNSVEDWDLSLALAKQLELTSSESCWSDIITRDEALRSAYLFEIGQFGSVIDTLEYDILNSDNVAIRPYIIELDTIPDEIINQFNRRSWRLIIDSEYLDSKESQYGDIDGLCDWGKKHIVVRSYSCIAHEFGHFYDYTHNWVSNTLYSEMKAGAKYLSDYSQTGIKEYFACAFDYFINNRNNTSKMNKMVVNTPKTYELFIKAESNNWK